MNIFQLKNYSVSKNILVKKIDDVVMVYNSDNGDMYEINEVGGEIFEYLQKELPVEDIISHLENDYDASRDEIVEATEDFLIRMIELGVVLL